MKITKKLLVMFGISVLSVGFTYAHNTIYFGIVNNTDGTLTFREGSSENFDFEGGDLSPSIPPGGKLNAQGDEEGTVWDVSYGDIGVYKDGNYYGTIKFVADDNVRPNDEWLPYPTGYFPVCNIKYFGNLVSCKVVVDSYHRIVVATIGGTTLTGLSTEKGDLEGSTHSYVDVSVQNTSITAPLGSWLKTCSNSKFDPDTGTLEADCYKQYGYTNHSTLNYRNMCLLRSLVSNNNGVLTCDSPAPAGSYRQTCLDPSINMATGTMTATCENNQGFHNYASLSNFQQCEWGIDNVNGQLVCAKPPIAAMSTVAKSGAGVVSPKVTSSQLHAQSVKPW